MMKGNFLRFLFHCPVQSRKFVAIASTGDLSRFSDTPTDGMLDDLFENPAGKSPNLVTKDTSSDSGFRPNQTHFQNGNTNLAATLKAKIAQKKEVGEISYSAKKSEMFPSKRDSGEEIDAGLSDLVNLTYA